MRMHQAVWMMVAMPAARNVDWISDAESACDSASAEAMMNGTTYTSMAITCCSPSSKALVTVTRSSGWAIRRPS
ncbi:hypothetical protein D3C71_1752490 [compost metagenome]